MRRILLAVAVGLALVAISPVVNAAVPWETSPALQLTLRASRHAGDHCRL